MAVQRAGVWGASSAVESFSGVPVRERLLDLLAREAYNYDPSKPFELASGERSAEYINCKRALSYPSAMTALGSIFYPLLLPTIEGVGGLTMGADPIACSISQHSDSQARPVRWFTVRKQPKKHGLMLSIEGGLPQMSRVTVVDDVVTQGGSTLEAISKCQIEGLNVMQVIVLVDRQQGGLERIKEEVPPTVPVSAIFTKKEIHDRWETLRDSGAFRVK